MTLLRRFTDFVLHSRLQAMAVAFVFSYVPLLGTISVLIVGLVTLRKGMLDGALVLGASVLPLGLQYFAGQLGPGFAWPVLIALLSYSLVWGFAGLLRRYNSWGLVLEYAFLLGLLVIGAAHVMVPDIKNWWGEELTQFFEQSNFLASLSPNDIEKSKQVKLAQSMRNYATGLMVASIWVNTLLQLVISRWWQAVLYNPGELQKELQRIRLGRVMAMVWVLCIALALFEVQVAMDMVPVALAIFSIAGLSVLHYFFKNARAGWFGLVLVYVGLIILFPISLMVFSTIAFLDSFMDVRKRLVKS